MLKTLHVRTTFGRSDVVLRGRREGLRTWSKVSLQKLQLQLQLQLQLHYITPYYTNYITLHELQHTTPHHTTLDYTTLPYITLRYTHYTTTNATATALHNNYSSTTLQLHYTTAPLHYSYTTTAALHHTTSSSCGWGGRPGDHCNHCNHSKKNTTPTTFNHLSVHQWVRSAIHGSQQPSSPIGFLFWNFRHRLALYYW